MREKQELNEQFFKKACVLSVITRVFPLLRGSTVAAFVVRFETRCGLKCGAILLGCKPERSEASYITRKFPKTAQVGFAVGVLQVADAVVVDRVVVVEYELIGRPLHHTLR